MEQSLIVSLDWNADGLNRRKRAISVLILSYLKLIILEVNRLEIFGQCLHRDDFWQYWVICKSDLLYVRSLFYATLTVNIAVRLRLLLHVQFCLVLAACHKGTHSIYTRRLSSARFATLC